MRRLFAVADLIADRDVHVIVTCGTGGVGKTSVSAALALAAAESGRRVALVTVDPAKRLATALGLEHLGGEPQPVPGVSGGSLDALMLDMTQTFDDAVRSHAPRNRVDEVLRNPFYKALSTSFSGTQDYMATEKLGQLYEQAQATSRWDLIVVDTPPSRSALDFLDAPARLDRLAEGPVLQVLAPSSGPLKLIGAGLSQVTWLVSKIIGSKALADLQVFASAFESVMGGFRRRASAVRALLSSPAAAFVIVASPRRAALDEARFFVGQLRERGTTARGVVVNQVSEAVSLSPDAQAALSATPEAYRWWRTSWVTWRAQRARMLTALPTALPVTLVRRLGREVTDLDVVRELGSALVEGAVLTEEDDGPVGDV
ncbi:MAG: ArsA family ATPase [Propionibacteriaceae bacterium]